MNRLVSIAAAAALSALAVAGTAQASTMPSAAAIGSLAGSNYNIVRIDSLDGAAARTVLAQQADASAVQRDIRANKSLMRSLEAQNVEIGNVVAADKAADGSVTFYLR